MDAGLLLLRVVVGLLLVGHGTRKLFGWFGGGGLAGIAWHFRSLGYWRPRLLAGFVGSAELAGVVGLAAGLLSPLAAAAVIATMLNAAVGVHRRNGLWAIDNGFEYPAVLAAAAAAVAFTGSGAASLDARLGLGSGGIESGVFAVALGIVAGTAALVSRAAARSETRLKRRAAPATPNVLTELGGSV
jgi:putative oxidoreductase